MANRYWVLGNGTWNLSATTNWSATSGGSGGASAPTYLDDVYFDTNSNVGTGVWTVTLDTAATCANFNVIYPDGALTIDKGTLNVNTLTVYGSYNIALSTGTGAANFLTIGTGLIKFVITTQSSSVFSLTVPSSSEKTLIGKNNQTGGTLTINTASATRNALGPTNISSLPILTTISTASASTISYNVFAPGYNRVVYIETLAPGPTLNNITSATLVSKNALGLINIPKIIVSENWSPFPTINNITSATLVGRDAFSKNDSPKNIIFEKFVPVPIIVNNTNITTIRELINQVGSTLNSKTVNIYEKFGETITNGITLLPYQFWG
jgi:hypothetical protein